MENIENTTNTKTTTSNAADQQAQQKPNEQKQQLKNELTPEILAALSELVKAPLDEFELDIHAISGVGENSYGLVLRIVLRRKCTTASAAEDVYRCILKIAPKNSARRDHMRVADFYAREVYMYDVVFHAYRKLLKETKNATIELDLMPQMLHYSLNVGNEFIIFEDLTVYDYIAIQRTQMADYKIAAMALQTLGKFDAMSFALQAKDKQTFDSIIAKLQPDNLFTPDIDPLSLEFGKSYVRRARNMIQSDGMSMHVKVLDDVERNFKEIGLRCVDGYACAPYAVISHGDFWNTNILNKYDQNSSEIISTKLIDFQMSRYASPILDLSRYLFVCTAHSVREKHFLALLHEVYYVALAEQLKIFDLNVGHIYPREIFEQQLRNYGVFGLCMAAFSLPFFVADTTDLPDLDKVSEAIKDIDTTNETTKTSNEVETNEKELNESRLKLIEEDYNLLTARTAPIFKQRMADIVADIVKYNIRTDFSYENNIN